MAAKAAWKVATALLAMARCLSPARAQKGIASLNDPCDCMQHHDYWMVTRTALIEMLFVPDFPERIFQEGMWRSWVQSQSCMYSPENEEAHRPTALSDCIPGFLLVHIVCMQRHIVDGRPEIALAYTSELARLHAFGAGCIDNSGWPITSAQVMRYYRRVRRGWAAAVRLNEGATWPAALLREMAWRPLANGAFALEPTTPLREEVDVCPVGAFADVGACWVLGPVGVPCTTVCTLRPGYVFREPDGIPAESLTPRLLVLEGMQAMQHFAKQHPWAPFECYVPGEYRFHLADFSTPLDPYWVYPVCRLACPCGPMLHPAISSTLAAVPLVPEA